MYSESNNLETLRARGTIVTVFLMNGFQLRGNIKAFDENTVVLHADGADQMIYKHAISTVKPHK